MNVKIQKTLRNLFAISLLLSVTTASGQARFYTSQGQRSPSYAETISEADVVLLAKVTSVNKTGENEGESYLCNYRILKVVKDTKKLAPSGELNGSTNILPVTSGELRLVAGVYEDDESIVWWDINTMSRKSIEYIVNSPAYDLPYEKRLPYFMKYLEHHDEIISNDAYVEFANAPYEEISKVAKQVPREQVRQWVCDKKAIPTRLGLYGLLLGLAGNETDAQVMLAKINEPTQDLRLGIDGIMAGYLMIAKDKGLDELEKSKLNGEGVSFSDTYAAMEALRFMWMYEPSVIEKDRLRKAMRLLLDRPEVAELVIADLMRWEDWEVTDRLIVMYDEEDYNIPSIKRSIIRFLLACSSENEASAGEAPVQATKAAKALEEIQEKDPKIYRDAKRFFRLR